MPRVASGNPYRTAEGFGVRVTLGPSDQRVRIALLACADAPAADKRSAIVADLAARLRAAAVPFEPALGLLKLAGERDEKGLADVLKTADLFCRGEARAKLPERDRVTFQDIGERWTSGELSRAFPDHVREKSTSERDRQRLERYVYPLVKGVTLSAFTVEHAERVMRALPPDRVRTAATRRQVAQIIHRILALAVYPLKILAANPLPKGFLPKVGDEKAKGWLYPDEDRRLLGHVEVPMCRRLLYGFLHREGCRFGEAASLDLADVNLDRGVLTLDENKTNDPRAWALGADVVRALRASIALREAAAGAPLPRSAPLFVDEAGERLLDDANTAKRFRGHLVAAGVTRDELHRSDKHRQRIRLHDTRASFVTLALAAGRNEAWVQDRTGHRSSYMVNRYRRAARMAEQLDLGWFAPLDAVIPELAPKGEQSPPDATGEAAGRPPEAAGPPRAEANGAPPVVGFPEVSTDPATFGAEGHPFESPNRGSNPRAGTAGVEGVSRRGLALDPEGRAGPLAIV